MILLFFLYIFISSIFAFSFYDSLYPTMSRMDGLLVYSHFLIFLFILSGTLRDKKVWRKYLFNLLLVGIIISIFVFFEKSERAISTLGNPIYLGLVINFFIFISLIFLSKVEKVKANRKAKIIFFSLLFVLFLYILFRSGSRGPFLGLVVGLYFSVLVYVFLVKNKFYKFLVFFLTFISIFST